MDTQTINQASKSGVLNRGKYILYPSIVSNGGLKLKIQYFEQIEDSYIIDLQIEELERDNVSVLLNSSRIFVSVGVNKSYSLSRRNTNSSSNSILKLSSSYYVLHRAEIELPVDEYAIERILFNNENKIIRLILRKFNQI